MSGLGRKLSGAFKRITRSSTAHSRGSPSTSRYSESPMHEDDDNTTQTSAHTSTMDIDEDAPYLQLEGDREMHAYALIKDREFGHTPAYDPDLLEKIVFQAR